MGHRYLFVIALAALLAGGGCGETPSGSDGGEADLMGVSDLGGADLARSSDLRGMDLLASHDLGGADLTGSGDLAAGGADLSGTRADLSPVEDLGGRPDLVVPGDLARSGDLVA